jgi:hypothetical protein
MRSYLQITMVAAVLLTAGCYTTGLSPREVGGETYAELIYGYYGQKPAGKSDVRIRRPFTLAVAQVGEVSPAAELLAKLRSQPYVIGRVIPVPLPGETPSRNRYYRSGDGGTLYRQRRFDERVRTLLVIAQQTGADYVLMIGGQVDSRTLVKSSELLDLAIIPAYLIRSKEVRIEATVAGAFIDVESGDILFLVTATSESTARTPSRFVRQTRESLSLAQREVLSERLASALFERLRVSTASQRLQGTRW